MNHLGQIMRVMPSAYTLEYEKCDSYKKSSSPYQLIITPILNEGNGNALLLLLLLSSCACISD